MATLRTPPSSPARLFGTDGIRGPAGVAPLNAPSLLRLGRALGGLLSGTARRPRVVVAGDTRASTPEICERLLQGLEERGCETLYAGVLPTPAVSRLAKSRACAAGIAVSASHNPAPDNGVKLVDGAGFKWPRDQEIELERRFALEPEPSEPLPPRTVDEAGRHETAARSKDRYLAELTALFPERSLAGLSVVLDTANGAASGLAATFFTRLGAEVDTLGDRPDGLNINRGCGSTDPAAAISETVRRGADLGFAFDGDADRALAIDASGALHDGDGMLYALAISMLDEGRLDPPRLVATSMSNLGLETALRRRGIEVVRCDVGDRAVVETLIREGLNLGGEQAGHIVRLDLSPTGDGLLSAALLARAVVSSGRSLADLTAPFRRFPQVLRNVEVASKPDLESLPEVVTEVERVERALGDSGRLVLRYSGTEPLARVMIEGPDQREIEDLAENLATTIAREIEALGARP